MAKGPIVLLTDYGLQDTYVGVVKGVIAHIAPGVPVIDLLHMVRPQQVRQGAYALWVGEPYFPEGSVFVVVVDPGVGTERRAVAVESHSKYFVAPDNGVLSFVLRRYGVTRAVVLNNSAYHLPRVSSTFHGRDIFAPVAAHLARGVELEAVGEPVPPETLCQLPPPRCEEHGGVWSGEVLHIDRFGNIVTSLLAEQLGIEEELRERARWRVRVRSLTVVGVSRTFADVPEGDFCAYVGSDGLLEVARRNGDAAATLGVSIGEEVHVWKA
ncbi:MAG: SAM-dependent chlorinase/fluorinase [Candidatus Kapabacteria bacterium]|nr:SAM-dependent chlorinase/fluorinase [Candidatus Kapabacteria bacterium]MDW8012093.1 SAM-dependent chlorinase/fluorinase [Bacteroidota bacterium]